MAKTKKRSSKKKQTLAQTLLYSRPLVGALVVLAGAVGMIAGYQTSANQSIAYAYNAAVCPTAAPGTAACDIRVRTNKNGSPDTTTAPAGYGPATFHGAYKLPDTATTPVTIGIVDAYDDPDITSDLARYDSTFGLKSFPTCSSRVTAACFSKVNESGGTTYPAANSTWSLETALDVETAHEICQNCKIVLVEASSSGYNDLMAAEDTARAQGAKVISNSYGSAEFSGETSYDSHFNYPGIAFAFSAGDNSYGAEYPASSPYVTAVAGTTLNVAAGNSYGSESVWSNTGSGCSAYEAKPSFQHDTGCSGRTVADVSADANPNTGAAIYDSVAYSGTSGWFEVGGTSLATPIVAGAYALHGGVASTVQANSVPYSNVAYGVDLHDVVTGSNGTCTVTYLCTAGTGYDGPSGLGTPLGLGAF